MQLTGETDRRVNSWTDGQLDRQTVRWTGGQLDWQIGGQTAASHLNSSPAL